MSEVKFNIYSGVLKAFGMGESEDGKRRLRTTASSTIRDLPGDEMTLKALQKMAATATKNMTIFLNHSYRVPEDVLGSVEMAEIHERGMDSANSPIYDLDFLIRVNESNERAVKTWDAIDNGTLLGCSIGAMIPDGGATRTDTGLRIDDVQLLEASIVGIPANPRSFVHYAAKAFHEAEVMATITSSVTFETKDVDPSDLEVEVDTVLFDEAEPEADADAPVEAEAVEEAPGPAPEAEVEVLSMDVPATQDALQSIPENDGAPGEADVADPAVDEALEALTSRGLSAISDLLKSTTRELVDSRKAMIVLADERDAALKRAVQAEEDFKLARTIVERIAALPIGRRTSFAGEISSFRQKFAGVYSDDVLRILEK